jgi:hypothetical protein
MWRNRGRSGILQSQERSGRSDGGHREQRKAVHISREAAAAASYNAASAFCPGFRLLVAFDGGSGAVDQNGTWAWPGSNWVQGHPTHSPSRRELLGMANDETIGHVVIFGGQTHSKFFGDTWELRPAAMHQ